MANKNIKIATTNYYSRQHEFPEQTWNCGQLVYFVVGYFFFVCVCLSVYSEKFGQPKTGMGIVHVPWKHKFLLQWNWLRVEGEKNCPREKEIGGTGVSSALNTCKTYRAQSHAALPILVILLWTQPLAVTITVRHTAWTQSFLPHVSAKKKRKF